MRASSSWRCPRGTSAALFLAARSPGVVSSLIVGSGASAYPLVVSGVLADMLAAPSIDVLPRGDAATAGVSAAVEAAASSSDEPTVHEDYVSGYAGDRFAESAQYVRSYPQERPVLADLLATIDTPVRVVVAHGDQLVPVANEQFLNDRLPRSRLTLLDAGHFAWEQADVAYGSLIAEWITGGSTEV